MLDLLLINPGNTQKMYQSLASEYRSIEPPWWAGILASYVEKHKKNVEILDADCDNLSPEQTVKEIISRHPKLALIVVQGCNPSASSTPKMSSVMEICKLLWESKPSFYTALCGLHPSALPEQTLKDTKANFVIKGEGFEAIIAILNGYYFRAPGLFFWDGGILKSNSLPGLLDGEELPPVAWHLLDVNKYRAPVWPCMADVTNRSPHAAIYTSLGCAYNCDFCQIKVIYNNKPGIRYRRVKSILDEIDLLVNKYGVKHIRLIDELFTTTERRVSEICDPIIERDYDLNCWVYARVDRVTPKMLEKLKKAGMPWVGYGFESATDVSLKGINKRTTRGVEDRAIQWTKDAGVGIMANYIFGLPDDTYESMNEVVNMMKKNLFEYANLYCCMAYPGSKLYSDISREHPEWLPKDWDGYSQLGYETQPLPTKYVDSAGVLKFRDWAFKEYFGHENYQLMIRNKFGDSALKYIQGMLRYDLKRKILE